MDIILHTDKRIIHKTLTAFEIANYAEAIATKVRKISILS